MEEMSILTQTQKIIFNQVIQIPYIVNNFYFTGGTALSQFYLHHRYSQDLDFFSEKKFDFDLIFQEITLMAKKINFNFTRQKKEVVDIYILKFNKEILKIDFGLYPYKRVEKGMKFKKLTIDSLIDIAINKLISINQRTSEKDFVDLYFLLQKFTIWDLIEGAKVKFKMEIEPWILASDLEYSLKDLQNLPKMIKPLTLHQLKQFFHQMAIDLGKKCVI